MQPYELKELAADIAGDVETLVQLLELEMDDILNRFFDKVVENKHKFGLEEDADQH